LVAGVEQTVAAIFGHPMQGKQPGETCSEGRRNLISTCPVTVFGRERLG
jgi:hypothetical protein